MVKYPLWVQKLLYYTIQHEGGRHIDFRQMSVSLGQTTANNCKTAFSLHVVESASDDYSFYFTPVSPENLGVILFLYALPGFRRVLSMASALMRVFSGVDGRRPSVDWWWMGQTQLRSHWLLSSQLLTKTLASSYQPTVHWPQGRRIGHFTFLDRSFAETMQRLRPNGSTLVSVPKLTNHRGGHHCWCHNVIADVIADISVFLCLFMTK